MVKNDPRDSSDPDAGTRKVLFQARRSLLHKEQIIWDLRRISRAANVETSIVDSAESVRARLLARGPANLTQELIGHLHSSMWVVPLPAGKPPSEMLSPPPLSQPAADAPRSEMSIGSCGAARPVVASPPRSAPPATRRPATARPTTAAGHSHSNSHSSVNSALQPRRLPTSPPLATDEVTDEAEVGVGAPRHVLPAAEFLSAAPPLEALESLMATPTPPSFSAILTRIIASAELLELELSHLVADASGDALKAVEAARLETLRAHIGALRSARGECVQVTRRADASVNELKRQLALRKVCAWHACTYIHTRAHMHPCICAYVPAHVSACTQGRLAARKAGDGTPSVSALNRSDQRTQGDRRGRIRRRRYMHNTHTHKHVHISCLRAYTHVRACIVHACICRGEPSHELRSL